MVVKKKTVIITAISLIFVIAISVTLGVFLKSEKASAFGKKVIVIDAGHGGPDRGVVGKNGTAEADKNLEIAQLRSAVLTDAGFYVVMTRTTERGDDEAASYKSEDFARRKRIIEKACPDMVISVHCNKFPSPMRRGAQVFFNRLNRSGVLLGQALQTELNTLNEAHVGRTYEALHGEYFMLNCSDAPSVIVECGFLSNAEDEALLKDAAYLEALCDALCAGVIAFFDTHAVQGA